MSTTWANRLASRLDERDADQRTRDALKLRRDELLKSQSGRLWWDFVQETREGVKVASKKCKDRIDFNELNVTTFKVSNLTYPMTIVRAEVLVDGICLSYYRRKDASSEAVEERKWVEIDLDANDRLVMTCDGRSLLGKDELLDFALGPVFRLPPGPTPANP